MQAVHVRIQTTRALARNSLGRLIAGIYPHHDHFPDTDMQSFLHCSISIQNQPRWNCSIWLMEAGV